MIIQIANIVAGFILAAPRLKQWLTLSQVGEAEAKLSKFRGTIGMVELVIGVIALLVRVGFPSPIYMLGASFPQAIAAIAIGLILSAEFFRKYPQVDQVVVKLEQHSEWIGLAGMAVGIGSIIHF